MATQALYRRWRSQDFDAVVGQEHVTHTLRNALRDGRMSHAYLFTGPRGTGKTSTARILAKAINCLEENPEARPCNRCRICIAISEGRQLDLIEIDAASNRGIDEIRDLREKIGFRPNEARYKIYIIDEVHMLTKEAFNALLKTLEEPPSHALFVLATTEPDRVPETVRSRCQRFDFRRIPTAEIVDHLAAIVAAEERAAAPAALASIARRSTGSMRDAISLLDQMLSYGDETLTSERVDSVLGLVDASTIGRLVDALAEHDAARGLELLNEVVAAGTELGQLVDQILAYLRGVLFVRVAHTANGLDVPEEVARAMMAQSERLGSPTLLAAIREFTDARAGLRDPVPGVPHLPIEMAFLRAALPREETTVAAAAPPPAILSNAPPAGPPSKAVVRPPAREVSPRQAQPPAAPPREAQPQAANVPTASPATPTKSDAAAGGLAEVAHSEWERFLELARTRCGVKVQAALRAVRSMEATGGALVLVFGHAFARDMVNEPEHRRAVEEVWQEVLGRPVQVRCAVVGESAPPPPKVSVEDEDEQLLSEAKKRGAVVKPLK